jgi:hypothetical protein
MSRTSGVDVSQIGPGSEVVAPGTLMHKAIPPRMVEAYLTGRRSIISGFVYRVADSPFASPRDIYYGLGLGYEGSEFSPDMPEVYMLRWRAVGTEGYQVPYSVARGGDWALKPPFTGTGYTEASQDRPVAEYFVDPLPVPVGAEIHRISAGQTEFIARYDGQVWLRPAEGPELCATGLWPHIADLRSRRASGRLKVT